ncbi:hypothetical protein [uncultured Thiodictyon sp.]|jgi:hypothetical protein|uniref:hypothetical protein n=1 Tax=uncultured Thiodictyon sp. TaxID=1846217 RepID=UPI002600F8CF|nr:hypothetical protein [uncultured Thiodictyon sp.]
MLPIKSQSAAWLALTIATMALGLALWGQRVPPPAPPGPPQNARQAEATTQAVTPVSSSPASGGQADGYLIQEVAALRQEVRRLRGMVANLRRDSQPDAEQALAAQAERDLKARDPEALRRDSELERVQQLREADAKFQRERRDAAWAQSTAVKLQEAMDSVELPPALVRAVDCRAQTCRVELAGGVNEGGAGETSVSVDKALPMLALALAESLPAITAYEVDNGHAGTTTVLFLSRDAQ